MATDFITPWDNRMCFEIALGIDGTEDILNRYQVTLETYEKWLTLPAFQKQLEDYRSYIRTEGLSFKEKAKVQAEDLLNTSFGLIHHPDVPAHVKADLIKWTAKMAELDPQDKKHGPNQPLIDDSTIKKLTDGELEIQVARIVSRRKETGDLLALEGEIVDGAA